MRKGTTPPFTFELPYDADMLDEAKITFFVRGKEVLSKYLRDCTVSGNILTLKLSQEETFLFECDGIAEVQLRVLEKSGEVRATDVYLFKTNRCLDNEVLVCKH